MPDNQLSQSEIDALFAEMTRSEETPEEATPERFRSVRPYDFRHPSKLSKEQLRTLQMIFEGFARQASATLSGVLRSQIHMALVSVEQAVFDDYARALPAKTVLNLVVAEPLPGTFVFEFDLGTAYVMLDRLLGGVGKAPQQEREVTDIEATLLQSVSAIFLDSFMQAWEHIRPLQAKLQRLEYSPRFLQIAPLNEPVVLLLFDLRIGERQSTVSMCIPYSVIEPVAADLNMQALFVVAANETALQESADAPQRLQRVTIPVVTLLGTTVLPLSAVSDLRVDDVLRLDGLASDPLIVLVNKKPTYVARPGLMRHNMAVQILGILHEDEVMM